MPVSEEVLSAAIDTYNEYWGSMATATLLDRSEDGFRVRFEGPFCRMCCDYDYYEDLLYELTEYDVDIDPFTIESIEQTGAETFVVEFTATREHLPRT
jgi:hypothetical protein